MEYPTQLPSDEQIRQTARAVLQRADYSLSPAGVDEISLLERIARAIVNFFRYLGQLGSALFEMSPVLAWLVIFALLLVAGVLILHIGYSFKVAIAARKSELALDRLDENRIEGPETLERKSRDAAASQDYIAALRHLLRAGLLRLEASQKKKPRWAATNREYLKRYRNTPAFEPLGWMVDLVDRKWYGSDTCSSVDYETGVQVYSRIRAASEEMLRAHRP